MSAEGPARKPTSEPPDVDSLMSRLDGEAPADDRTSDPGVERGRPSAAELLGGRGRRSKRAIRVPDDAVPAASPPSAPMKRSAPPPPPAVAEKLLSAPSFLPEVVAVRPQRIISVGGPGSTEPTPISGPSFFEAGAPVATSEPTPIAPEVAAIAPGVIAPFFDPTSGAMPPVHPASDVRLAAAPEADAAPITPPRRSVPPPPPIRTPTPFASPFVANPPNFPRRSSRR